MEPNPNPETPPETPPALTQADLDKAVAEAEAKRQEEIERLQKEHQKETNQLIASMNQSRGNPQPAPSNAPPPISADEFARAVEEGDSAKVALYMDQKLTAKDQQWEEKFNQIQSFGVEAIGNLAKQQAANSTSMPYFNEFKDEVDALLLKHNATATPEAIQNAYNLVAGQNINKILKMEMEKKARQENPPEGTITPGDVSMPRGTNPSQTPFSAEAVLSDEAKKALKMRHDPMSPDQYTQKLSRGMGVKFENFEQMYNKRDELIAQDKEMNEKW